MHDAPRATEETGGAPEAETAIPKPCGFLHLAWLMWYSDLLAFMECNPWNNFVAYFCSWEGDTIFIWEAKNISLHI